VLRPIEILANLTAPAAAAVRRPDPDLLPLAELAEFLANGFVVSLFVGIVTVSALHLARPLLREVAQMLSLNSLAHLPKGLRTTGWQLYEREDEPEEGLQWKEEDSFGGDLAVVAALAGLTPSWMDQATGEWLLQDREWWARARHRSLESRPNREWRPLAKLAHHRAVRQAGFSAVATLLPDDLFMRTIENEAKAVIARPSQNPFLFTLLTARAPADARAVVARFDDLARRDPAQAAALTGAADGKEGGANVAAGIIAAQNAVAAAAESWLDRFQLSLASQSLIVSRLFAVVTGIGFAVTASWFIEWKAPAGLIPLLGLSGGLLGLLANDAAAAWVGRRR
jgi:hypothetical protein